MKEKYREEAEQIHAPKNLKALVKLCMHKEAGQIQEAGQAQEAEQMQKVGQLQKTGQAQEAGQMQEAEKYNYNRAAVGKAVSGRKIKPAYLFMLGTVAAIFISIIAGRQLLFQFVGMGGSFANTEMAADMAPMEEAAGAEEGFMEEAAGAEEAVMEEAAMEEERIEEAVIDDFTAAEGAMEEQGETQSTSQKPNTVQGSESLEGVSVEEFDAAMGTAFADLNPQEAAAGLKITENQDAAQGEISFQLQAENDVLLSVQFVKGDKIKLEKPLKAEKVTLLGEEVSFFSKENKVHGLWEGEGVFLLVRMDGMGGEKSTKLEEYFEKILEKIVHSATF